MAASGSDDEGSPKEMSMKNRKTTGLFGACAGLLLPTVIFAQLPPAAQVLPQGFKVAEEVNLGATLMIKGTKPNENFPKPHADPGIAIEIVWMNNPAVDQILEMAAGQPEDPAGRIPGSATREEPCGNERYREGVRRCRKVITPWIGAGRGPDLVTWRIGWTGKGRQGGLVSVSVNNFFGPRETAFAWIDAIIPKISTAK
jgi:hypothetical protein